MNAGDIPIWLLLVIFYSVVIGSHLLEDMTSESCLVGSLSEGEYCPYTSCCDYTCDCVNNTCVASDPKLVELRRAALDKIETVVTYRDGRTEKIE
jgi:hypothetical protein